MHAFALYAFAEISTAAPPPPGTFLWAARPLPATLAPPSFATKASMPSAMPAAAAPSVCAALPPRAALPCALLRLCMCSDGAIRRAADGDLLLLLLALPDSLLALLMVALLASLLRLVLLGRLLTSARPPLTACACSGAGRGGRGGKGRGNAQEGRGHALRLSMEGFVQALLTATL